MKKNKIIWYLVGGIVVLIIFSMIAKKKGWIGKVPPIEVTTEKVKHSDLIETVSANGKIQPEVEVKMSADVSGEIVELNVKEGDVVKKGDLLCKINPDIYNTTVDRMIAAVNTSKANLENAKARLIQSQSTFTKTESTHKRNKKLFDQGTISPSDIEASQSTYDVAKQDVEASQQNVVAAQFNVTSSQASVKEAQDNLLKTSIFAPRDGTVSKLGVEKGERVVGTSQMTGTEIMRIADLSKMEVNVDVNENEIVKVHYGDTALIEVDAYLKRKFKGVVYEMANSANSSGTNTDMVTNFVVKIRILKESYEDLIPKDHPDQSPFRPGMSATVDIQTKRTENALVVPIQAVTTRDTTANKKDNKMKDDTDKEPNQVDKNKKTAEKEAKDKNLECVFLNIDGKAKLQLVKTGIQDNNNIEILIGLKEGDEVVTAPYSSISKLLKENDVLKVVKKEDLYGGNNKK